MKFNRHRTLWIVPRHGGNAVGKIVKAQIAVRQHLCQQDDLPRVHREMFDNVIDGFEHCHIMALDAARFEQLGRIEAASTASVSASVSFNFANNSARGSKRRSSNSSCRTRRSGCPPTPLTIHCRTLPARCSNRLPILFDSSPARHRGHRRLTFRGTIRCVADTRPSATNEIGQ